MSTNEMMDMALKVYQRLGLTFLRLTIVPAVFCLGGLAFVTNFVLPELMLTSDTQNLGVQLGEVIAALALAVFVGGPVFLTGLSYTTAVVVQLVSNFMVGHPVDEEHAQRIAREALPRMVWVNLRVLLVSLSGVLASTALMMAGAVLERVTPESSALAGVVAVVGILGLVVGFLVFLYVVSYHALAAPVAVIERAKAKLATKRSKELLSKAGYHQPGTNTVWSLYVLIAFAALIMSGGLAIMANLLKLGEVVGSFVNDLALKRLILVLMDLIPPYLVVWTLMPVWATTITILYYERRIRLEGYDIEALAAEIPRRDHASRFDV